MADGRSQVEQRTVRLGDDGELIAGKFCAYCGDLNDAESTHCQHCGEYIVDQGPDLSLRLARISRRVNGTRRTATQLTPHAAAQLIGAETDRQFGIINTLGILFDSRARQLDNAFQRLSVSRLVLVLHIVGLSLEILLVYLPVRLVLIVIVGH